jgi:hypothetical protein
MERKRVSLALTPKHKLSRPTHLADRKPIDPPPIVEIHVADGADPQQYFLQSPYLFVVCQLVSAQEYEVIKTNNGKCALAGSVSSSLHKLKNADNSDGGFFVFGDVSAKVTGEYRLQFCLFDARFNHKGGPRCIFLKEIYSDPFKGK